jgi:hypothetical protein
MISCPAVALIAVAMVPIASIATAVAPAAYVTARQRLQDAACSRHPLNRYRHRHQRPVRRLVMASAFTVAAIRATFARNVTSAAACVATVQSEKAPQRVSQYHRCARDPRHGCSETLNPCAQLSVENSKQVWGTYTDVEAVWRGWFCLSGFLSPRTMTRAT